MTYKGLVPNLDVHVYIYMYISAGIYKLGRDKVSIQKMQTFKQLQTNKKKDMTETV